MLHQDVGNSSEHDDTHISQCNTRQTSEDELISGCAENLVGSFREKSELRRMWIGVEDNVLLAAK